MYKKRVIHVRVVVLLVKTIAPSPPLSCPLLPSPPVLPAPPLRDTRKSSFYCHPIFNLLGFDFSGINKGEKFLFD